MAPFGPARTNGTAKANKSFLVLFCKKDHSYSPDQTVFCIQHFKDSVGDFGVDVTGEVGAALGAVGG
jgi:hypothetical protein